MLRYVRDGTRLIIFVNGAFGVGKTTVAREIVTRLPSAVLFDPEVAGIVLQRLARLGGRKVDDFQDLTLWRRLTVVGLRVTCAIWPNVVVPMAFSNVEYLDEIRSAVARFESRAFHFCLIAPLEVVRQRLSQRRARNAYDAAWQDRRAAECCVLHARAEFAPHVQAFGRTPAAIAAEIVGAVVRP